MRKIIDGRPVPIQDVVDHSFDEFFASCLAWFQAPFKRIRGEDDDKEEPDTESERPRRGSFRVGICIFCLRVLPLLTLVGLFMFEYATDTIAKCKLRDVKLENS